MGHHGVETVDRPGRIKPQFAMARSQMLRDRLCVIALVPAVLVKGDAERVDRLIALFLHQRHDQR